MDSSPFVALSDSAVSRVKALIENEGNAALNLRVTVSGGGCNGFSYGFDLDETIADDDKVFEYGEVKLVIDEVSLDLLTGSVIDYKEDLLAASFRIENPQASSTCGCGTSFAIG